MPSDAQAYTHFATYLVQHAYTPAWSKYGRGLTSPESHGCPHHRSASGSQSCGGASEGLGDEANLPLLHNALQGAKFGSGSIQRHWRYAVAGSLNHSLVVPTRVLMNRRWEPSAPCYPCPQLSASRQTSQPSATVALHTLIREGHSNTKHLGVRHPEGPWMFDHLGHVTSLRLPLHSVSLAT
jgi:hypothetical protein